MKNSHFAVAGLISCTVFAAAGRGDLIVSTWIGPSGGLWGDAANWTNGAPNNGVNTWHAVIDNDSNVNKTVNLNWDPTLDMLTVDAGDQLLIGNDRDIAIASITNNGVITLDATANWTHFQIRSNFTSLAGSGELVMSNSVNNRISGTNYDITLVNEAAHTIRGAGLIGLDVIELINHGLVQADQPATALHLDLRNGTLDNFNDGTMQATNGATLSIFNSAIDNSNGLIRAQDASFVDLSGATLIGGEFTTVGSGLVRTTGNSTLVDPTNTGHISVLNSTNLTFSGTTTNQDLITLDAAANWTHLNIYSNPTTFTGSGEVVLGDNANNRVSGSFFDITLVNDTAHTIRGAGQIGLDVIELINNGLVQADQSATPLSLDLRNGTADNFNNSTMQATNGATLNIFNSAIDNSNGLIRAQDASFVDLNGAHLVGGEFTTVGSGLVRTTGNSTLVDPTNTGHIKVLNNTNLTFSGTTTNQNLITLNATDNWTHLMINSNPTTFTGAGEVVLGNDFDNRISGNFYDITLVNDSAHTIRGAGQIGLDVIELINNGLVQADQPATPLSLDLRNGTADNFNNSTMQATNGATLTIVNSAIDNSNGLIRAQDASFVDLNGAHLVGGEFTTVGSGLVRTTGNSTLVDPTNTGHIKVLNNTNLNFFGTTTNQNLITLNATDNWTHLVIYSNPTTFTGDGEVVMGDNAYNRVSGAFYDITLVNGAGHTIRGSGQIGLDVIDIINQGSIISDSSAGIFIDQRNSFNNQGLLHVTGNGSMTIWFAPFTTSGNVLIDAGRTLTRQQNFDQTAGTTTVNGTLNLQSGGTLNLTGGTVKGAGQIIGPVNNAGGWVEPGASAGTLVINGSYTQSNAAAFRVEIGGPNPGTGHDVLNVTGTATLAGAIQIAVIDRYKPKVNQTFTVLTAGTRNGQFQAVGAPPGMAVIYQGNNVLVKVLESVCPADITVDDLVNVNDLLAVINSWGPCPNSPCPPSCVADVTQDCNVNVNDLLAVINTWGACP